jgi:A/G-specific adenine glycosylase
LTATPQPRKPAEPDISGSRWARARRRLLAWYDLERRDLPWRGRDDAYAIWISEIMLQQTRVEVVRPAFERFLAVFPDPSALAAASEEDVLSLWSGLGYYTRARNLRRGAAMVCETNGGRFPECLQDALRIPGVGRYTAAAVLSIAFGACLAVVDGNVRRVLARVFLVAGGNTPQSRFEIIANEFLSRNRPGDHNQAMMELGATVCLPRIPSCGGCPLALVCRARAEGRIEDYPTRPEPPAIERSEHNVFLLRDRRNRLLLERGCWSLLDHLWLPPIRPAARAMIGGGARDSRSLGSFRHAITRHRLTLHVLGVVDPDQVPNPDPSPHGGEIGWFGREQIARLGRSSILQKALRMESRTETRR